MMAVALDWWTYQVSVDDLRPFILDSIKYSNGTQTLRGVEADIEAGILIPVALGGNERLQGLVTIELDDDALHVRTVAGKFDDDWLAEVLEMLGNIAREQNKRIISGQGRKGWSRYLKPHGFKTDGNKFEVEI